MKGSGGSSVSCWRVLGSVVVLIAAGAVLLAGSAAHNPDRANLSAARFTSRPPLQVSYAQLPLIFEANQGQSDARVKFLARGSGYGLFLTSNEAVLQLRRPAVRTRHSGAGAAVVAMSFAGANPSPSVAGSESLPGKSNYLIGNDPTKWHRNVPQFARVSYRNLYPGVDLVYYGRQGRLEYDFEVAPGADPHEIALQFAGARGTRIDQDGNLTLAMADGQLEFQAPRIYQVSGEKRQAVKGHFVMRGDRVGFEIADYDRTRALIIDPVLTYSSYLGGTGDESCSVITGTTTPPLGCPSVAVDAAFNIYIAGATTSTDFPLVSGGTPFQGTLNGTAADVFIAKLNSTGSALTFSTYLGGTGTDTPAGIAVDNGFNVAVAGTTTSADFPTGTTAFQTTATGTHVFVSKLDPTGATLLYSSYLGGNGTDTATGLALNSPQADIHVTGTTTSSNFPVTSSTAFQPTPKATNQFFFAKFDPTAASGAASLLYSSYLGGATPSTGTVTGGGIAVDANSNVYLTGATQFTDMGLNSAEAFPTCAVAGCSHAIIGKFDLTKSATAQELYLTYVGDTGTDIGTGIAVDSSNNAYITGSTSSMAIPTVTGTTPFQAAYGGGATDAFLVKAGTPCTGTACTTTNVPINYFSYLGGAGDDIGTAIAVDASQGAHITGSTTSTNFPVLNNNGIQPASGGGTDAFVTRIDTTATSPTALGHTSFYLGGSGTDIGTGVASDAQGNTYVVGETSSTDLPVVSAFQSALSGGAKTDAFVTKYIPNATLAMTATASPTSAGAGSGVTFTYTITNNGDQVTGVTFTDFLPSTGATLTSASTTAGSCGAASGGTVSCSLGTLNAGATATVTVVLTPSTAGTLSNSAQLAVPGSSFTTTASATAPVSDYTLTVSPTSMTVQAGVPATYTATLTPSGGTFPNSVTLSCSSGLPAATMCTVTNGDVIPDLSTGAQSRQIVLNTTIRPTASLHRSGALFYALWLPVSGLAFVGLGGKKSRKPLLMLLLIIAVLGLLVFQGACGSSSSTPTTTGGTPAGTYTINITATSGTLPFTQTVPVTLIVQ